MIPSIWILLHFNQDFESVQDLMINLISEINHDFPPSIFTMRHNELIHSLKRREKSFLMLHCFGLTTFV